MSKAVIFDLDGTLYDKSHLPLYLSVNQLFKGKLSLLAKERSVRKVIKGETFQNAEAFSDAFFQEFRNKDAKKWFYDNYLPETVKILKKHYSVATWVEPLLAELRNSEYKIAVFSDYEFVREKLTAIGFDLKWADFYFEAPKLHGLKPCKESFMQICAEMDVKPEQCIMIGDREDTDGAGAHACGMKFVKVEKAERPKFDF